MKFDEEAIWRWEANEESNYDFFPYFGEEDQESITSIQEGTPPSYPICEASSSFEESSSERKMRNIKELYDEIELLNLFCLFTDNEP